MTFVSYAQNFEDVMLWRALKHVNQGFYIDVGAGSPRQDSVTCAFSQRGWRGINIEPNPYFFAQTVESRPRDINLPVAVGDRTGTLKMSITPCSGLSTGDPSIAAKHVLAGIEVEMKDVELTTLNVIWSKYVPVGHEVHFLKIDVEGLESEVIRGNNWSNNRPWIVVVEATYPNSPAENYLNWEEFLVSGGYAFCYADGLNRFYVAKERSELTVHFRYPPNVFDGFQPPNTFERFVTVHEADLNQALSKANTQLGQTRAQLERSKVQVDEGKIQLEQTRAQLEQTRAQLEQTKDQLEEGKSQLEQTRDQLEQGKAQLTQLISEQDQARAELSQRISVLETRLVALTSSSSWRLTEPLRRLSGKGSVRTRRNLRRAAKAAWWAITPWHFPARIRLIRERMASSKIRGRVRNPNESRSDVNGNEIEVVEQRSCSYFDNPYVGKSEHDPELCVELMYQCYLGRGADPDGFRARLDSVRNGTPLSTLAREIQNSPEAVEQQRRRSDELALCVDLIYQSYLGRRADPGGLRACLESLRNGTSLSTLAREIQNCPEAVERRRRSEFGSLSDGEFVVALAEFQGRGCLPNEVEHWRSVLADGRVKRIDLLATAAEAFFDARRRGGRLENDPGLCQILGTERWLARDDWENKAKELSLAGVSTTPRPAADSSKWRPFQHSGEYVVSAIASLYKGGRHIEHFLENITTQNIFDRSELIIIDADSPEGEEKIIAQYQKNFPNIVYRRINHRLGIYDAWNIAVQMSRGRYLTNTNLDDLRRRDSFEIQAATLERYEFIDVVYQDFFYSFDDSLSFEDIEKFGFKSELPIVTPHNLLQFNSPHNAPMWRKSLHSEIGLFDTSYDSAGDWEFWLRCLSNGKNFLKINTPHVAYFQNPKGISTRPDTRGFEEGKRILRSYSDKLISSELRLSRESLAEALETHVDWDTTTSYYDVVQRELDRLGARFKGKIATTDTA